MATVDFSNDFRRQFAKPLDTTFVTQDEASRLAIPDGALYKGMVTVQLDNNTAYVFTGEDSSANIQESWEQSSANNIVDVTVIQGQLSVVLEDGTTFGPYDVTGPRGSMGEHGTEGQPGATGAAGADATPLTIVSTGRNGLNTQLVFSDSTIVLIPDGAKGEAGQDGAAGIDGLKGDRGIQGETGAKGDQGEQGIQGVQGEQGEQGDAGTMGLPGETGAQGPLRPQPDWDAIDGSEQQILNQPILPTTGIVPDDWNTLVLTDELRDAITTRAITRYDTQYTYNNGDVVITVLGLYSCVGGPHSGEDWLDTSYWTQITLWSGGSGGGTTVVANPNTIATDDLNTILVGTTTYNLPSGGGSTDLFHDITKNGRFLDTDGIALPSGNDATDNLGNTDAQYNEVMYNNVTYYWIQNKQVPIRSAIIRSGNRNTGDIVATKNY